jgi:hypothetical protein
MFFQDMTTVPNTPQVRPTGSANSASPYVLDAVILLVSLIGSALSQFGGRQHDHLALCVGNDARFQEFLYL